MSFPIKVNSITIELTVHTSCYCIFDLLCVILYRACMGNFIRGFDYTLRTSLNTSILKTSSVIMR